MEMRLFFECLITISFFADLVKQIFFICAKICARLAKSTGFGCRCLQKQGETFMMIYNAALDCRGTLHVLCDRHRRGRQHHQDRRRGEEGVRKPLFVRAADPVASLFGALGKYTYDNGIPLNSIEKIVLTGVGSAYINQPLYGIPTAKADEFLADGLGATYHTDLKETIVVSMGNRHLARAGGRRKNHAHRRRRHRRRHDHRPGQPAAQHVRHQRDHRAGQARPPREHRSADPRHHHRAAAGPAAGRDGLELRQGARGPSPRRTPPSASSTWCCSASARARFSPR